MKDDAIPTRFTHNADKQPAKRKFSILREHERAKRQHCKDAFLHSEQVECFEFEYNTKQAQTERVILVSSSTQTPPLPTKADIGVQCCIEIDICNDELSKKKIREAETQSEENKDYQGSDFHVSDVSGVDELCEETVHTTNDVQELDKAAFIVYWTSLLVLLQRCLHLTCVLPAAITNKGSQLIVKLKCQNAHTNTCKSQPTCNRYSVGNLTSPSAVLFRANTYQRIASFFDRANIQWLSKTSYHAIQKQYLTGIVNKYYIKMPKSILEEVKEKGLS